MKLSPHLHPIDVACKDSFVPRNNEVLLYNFLKVNNGRRPDRLRQVAY